MTADEDAAEPSSQVLQTWSDAQTLAHKDFAEFTADEIALARAAMERLEWSPGERRTRRWVRGHGPRVDLRRALAHSVRTGGDVFELPRRKRRTRERPVVLLCDVSGSMERYSRMLLHFAHAIGRRQRRVEVFVFSTALTRVTHELRARRLNEAAAEVARSAPDWSGGTRIGDALRQFHQRWARRSAPRRPGRAAHLGRLGSRRSGRAARADQAAAAELPSPDLAQPADRHPRLRPADAGTAGGAAVRGRLPARPDAEQSRGPGATLEQALPGHATSSTMDIAGSYTFHVPPDQVWALLMDPAVISSCIPGCDSFEPTGENSYRARLTVALAAITGSYEGTVTLSDLVPHTSYRLTAEGKGRPGFVKGSAAITLRAGGRDDDRGRHRHGADGRPDRAPGPAPDRRRLEDDARPLLRVGGRDQRRLRREPSLPTSAPAREHLNHRTTVVRAGVEIRVHLAQLLTPPICAARSIVALRQRLTRQGPLDVGQPTWRGTSRPVNPTRADTMVPPLTSSDAATPTMA